MTRVLKREIVDMPLQFSNLVRTEEPRPGEIMWPVEILTVESPAAAVRARMEARQRATFGKANA